MARHGAHKELPSLGITRNCVVLSRTLARCQREAEKYQVPPFYGAVCALIPGRQPA
jgi:hypothetical protein